MATILAREVEFYLDVVEEMFWLEGRKKMWLEGRKRKKEWKKQEQLSYMETWLASV